jgi:CheY-like chemotaxis protein/signal transduction histidine kinase
MKILNRFLSFFIQEHETKMEIEARHNYLITNLISFFLFLVVISEGIFSLVTDNLFGAVPLLLFSLIFFIIYLYVNRSVKSASSYKTINIIFILITEIYLLLFGNSEHLDFLWIGAIPFVAISLFNIRKGSLISFSFLAFILLDLLLLSKIIPNATVFTTQETIAISGYYLFTIIVAYTLYYISSEIILNKEKQMLDTKNMSKTQEELISKLSHQIRTPLSNITGIIDILEKTQLNDDQRDYINTIHASANNLVNVVNSLVATTTTNFSQVPSEEINFNLYSTLNNTVRLFQDNHDSNKFSISLDADVPSNMTGNSIRIKQILLNLMNNILKYNNNEIKEISIEVKRKEEDIPGMVLLNFIITSNTVISIPRDSIENQMSLYDKDIIRLNTAKYVSFLDLRITQRLIELDGNQLFIYPSSESTRIEFTARFKEEQKSRSINNIKEAPKQTENIFKNSIEISESNILLVEDNFSNQQIILLYLKNEVRKIDVAFNGKEALDKFGKAKYDLILMDIQMPIMDGFKATRKIREIEKSTNTHTPIIAVTANAFPEDKEKCFAAGMDDYISKPFQPEDLIRKIKKHLS